MRRVGERLMATAGRELEDRSVFGDHDVEALQIPDEAAQIVDLSSGHEYDRGSVLARIGKCLTDGGIEDPVDLDRAVEIDGQG